MIVNEMMTMLGFSLDGRNANKFDEILNRLRGNAEATAGKIRTSLAVVAAAGVAVTAALMPAVNAVAQAGDEMTGNLNKLEGALGSAERARQIYEQLYTAVRETGADLTETATAFGTYNLAMSKNNRTAEDTVRLVTGLQAAMTSLGLQTSQVNSVTTQLGQALGKGTLNGDELVSLREAMPQLVDELRKALKLTDEQFLKAAEKGELTAEKLIGPLLEYTDRARTQLNALPMTMGRATAKLRTTWSRFLADLDRTLGISQVITRNLSRFGDWLEGLRRHIRTLEQIINRLGGLEAILRVVGYAVGIVTAALVAMNAQLLVTAGRFVAAWAAAAAPVIAVGTAVAGLALLLDDFVRWVQGNTAGTLFGRWFGDFQSLSKPVIDGVARLKDSVVNSISAMQPQIEWLVSAITVTLAGAARLLVAAWEPVGAFFRNLWSGIAETFKSSWNTLKPVLDALTGAAQWLSGSGPLQPGEQTAPRRGGLNRSHQLGGFPTLEQMAAPAPGPDLAGRMARPANSNTVTQTVNQSVTVNATGNSPAEVASAAQRGVAQGTAQMVPALGDAARALSNGNPRVEAAAQ